VNAATAAGRGARSVLLDLDGTLSDPKDGIISAYRFAMKEVGRPMPADEDLTWIIGPPLRVTFLQALGDERLALAALGYYRAHYGERGLYESTPYPGVRPALEALRAEGDRLFLATSKLVDFAGRILVHFGIVDLFDGIYGSQLDGSYDNKADLIALILQREGLDPVSCVMVGDRKHDVIGANVNRIPCIGATWGYGGEAELRAAGAAALCASPAELPACVRRVFNRSAALAAVK
jgi:phosphoglycolate phosphatase